MTNDGSGASGSSGRSLATGVAIVVAILALAFFVVQIIYMQRLVNVGVQELQWTRSVYLFGAIEALAFSAAGYLWGREVNRQRAEKAEARAEKNEGEAKQAHATAAEVTGKAQSLKDLAILKAEKQGQKARTYGSLGSDAVVTATKDDLTDIADLAQRLFPGV